jgi:hypothetical protein
LHHRFDLSWGNGIGTLAWSSDPRLHRRRHEKRNSKRIKKSSIRDTAEEVLQVTSPLRNYAAADEMDCEKEGTAGGSAVARGLWTLIMKRNAETVRRTLLG